MINKLYHTLHGRTIKCPRKAVHVRTEQLPLMHANNVLTLLSHFRSRFLDSRTFVSCSDDTTVCVWDVRSLKHNMRTLHGHSNWVKNAEYVHSLGLLVTSGFDGSIYTWDINRRDVSLEFKYILYDYLQLKFE